MKPRRTRQDQAIDRALSAWTDRQGTKIPCPYCDGKGHNVQADTECGFCVSGVHVVGT